MPVVIERWFCRLHLIERQPPLDHVFDALLDDRHHVAVLEHVGFIADPPLSRNDERAPFLLVLRHREVEQPVQSVDDPVDTAAAGLIDDRIAAHVEQVASHDHVRSAEEHDRGSALTAKGEDLRPVMRAMVEWGVRHAGGHTPPPVPPRHGNP